MQKGVLSLFDMGEYLVDGGLGGGDGCSEKGWGSSQRRLEGQDAEDFVVRVSHWLMLQECYRSEDEVTRQGQDSYLIFYIKALEFQATKLFL